MPVIGDFIKIKHGYAFKGDYISTEDNNIVLVTPGNFAIGGGFKEQKCKFYIGKYPDDYVLKEDDLIVTMTDLSKSVDTLGYGALVPSSNKRVYLHNQRIGLVQFISDKIDKHYLYWYMRTSRYQRSIVATSSGSTVHHTSPDRICEVEIEVPEMKIQKKIAGFLDDIEEKINVNENINRNLSEQARSVYMETFGKFEKTKVLEDYPVKIYSGGTPSTSKKEYWEGGDIHWLSSGETANEFVITTDKTITQLGVDNSSTKWASKYDVVTASAGQGHTRGQTTMILLNTCINQSVIVTHAAKEYMPFIFFNLSGRYEELRVLSDGTSTRGSLTTKIMAKLKMPDVTENTIIKFSEYAWSVISQIEVNLKENEKLACLRDSLLLKLMTGEIDVSDLNI